MNAVIIGASAGVGRALCEKLTALSWNLVISARDERDLIAVKNNVEILYGTKVFALPFDLTEKFIAKDYLEKCKNFFSEIDAVFIPAGFAIEEDDGMLEQEKIEDLIQGNYSSIIPLLSVFLSYFNERNRGHLIVISSIAAAAPRKRNVVYASAKKALETYCAGMQHAFADKPINIKVYALGYVDTMLTYGIKFPLPIASPQKVADYITSTMNKNFRFRYYPRFWAVITCVLKFLPWFIYKRLSF